MKKIIICLIITMTITSTVNAAEVPKESAPCNATNEAIIIVERFIGNRRCFNGCAKWIGICRCKSKIEPHIL